MIQMPTITITWPAVTAKANDPMADRGMNNLRRDSADTALRAFAAVTGSDETVRDLLGNLMHWCDEHHVDFADELRRGTEFYIQEKGPLYRGRLPGRRR